MLTVERLECPGCGAPVRATPGEVVFCRYCAASLLVTWTLPGTLMHHPHDRLSALAEWQASEAQRRARLERLARQRGDFAFQWVDLDRHAAELGRAAALLAAARRREWTIAPLAATAPLAGALIASLGGGAAGLVGGVVVGLAALAVFVSLTDRIASAVADAYACHQRLACQHSLRLSVYRESLARLAEMDRELALLAAPLLPPTF